MNVLSRSPLFSRLIRGDVPPCNYIFNGDDYTMGYCLVNGIYPIWAAFVKTITRLEAPNRSYFATTQYSTRKDVKRPFVPHNKFAIISGTAEY
jgi:hypothetical protein